jgi:hypothetical protein
VSCPVEIDATKNEWSHTDQEWRELLSPEQYAVLREAATELRPEIAFKGEQADQRLLRHSVWESIARNSLSRTWIDLA